MELKTEDQLVPVQTPVQTEVKKRGRPRKTPKPVCGAKIYFVYTLSLTSLLFNTQY